MNQRIETNQSIITAGGITLKVFQNRGTPRLTQNKRPSEDPLTLKAIHSHFAYEVFFVCNGLLRLVTEGETYRYQNAVVIIPPQIKHYSFNECEGNYCLLFFPEDSPAADLLTAQLNNGITTLPLPEELPFYLRQLEKKDLPSSTEERRLLTALILHPVINALLPDGHRRENSRSADGHIDVIEDYINSRLRGKLTLTEVSGAVALSTRQISRIIQKEYGMTFSQLVADKRLAAANIMLKSSALPIHEIAELTFPGSESYFYTLFKKKCGISPLQYRKNSRREG